MNIRLINLNEYNSFTKLTNKTGSESTDVKLSEFPDGMAKTSVKKYLDGFYLVTKLAGELGELNDAIIIASDRTDYTDKYTLSIMDEIGDIIWYLSEISNWMETDLRTLATNAYKKEHQDFDDLQSHLHCSCKDVPASHLIAIAYQKISRILELYGKMYRNSNEESSRMFYAFTERAIVELLKDMSSLAHNMDTSLNIIVNRNIKKLEARLSTGTIRSSNRDE